MRALDAAGRLAEHPNRIDCIPTKSGAALADAAGSPEVSRGSQIRLQYLRYRLNGRTRTQADKDVRINHFPEVKTGTIEFNTRGCLLDKKEI